ncbi:hypothetical protein RBH29_08705 [Herbivorax sp. ANBcel31]|uniref:hypothetical protein n=1 Tax=Herbivorax sp. ANBcel31 TaxID=3069754 RepID=UPI0027B74EB1|nr:hypothetical protein [Herbivorax sp. ANBcel31]MDQ2086506.1 hypothetical protein [Herbivorax sp. ANBcel31]
MGKNIENTCVDIENNTDYTKRLDALAVKLDKTKECKEINSRYNELYKSLENAVPKEKQELIRQLDDTYMELLIIHEDFFYKNGHLDRPEFKGFFKKLKNWLFGLQNIFMFF